MEARVKTAKLLGAGPKSYSRQAPEIPWSRSNGMGWRGSGDGRSPERGSRGRGILILADSMAAIQGVKKAGRTGKAR